MDYSPEQLAKIIEDHRLYLRGERGARANLAWANLEEANLERANLEGANLEGTNLEGANLAWATRGGLTLGRRPPHQIMGGEYSVLVWDDMVEVGCERWTAAEFAALDGFRGMSQEHFASGKALILALVEERRVTAP